MTDVDLMRFVEAQDGVRDEVRRELTAGRKTSHWMWFVFPQLRGLGRSPTAKSFAIRDLEQARRYLEDPVLGDRLRADVALMLSHEEKSVETLLGTPDDLKFRSCLTLFREAATRPEDRALFQKGLDIFYAGSPDDVTLQVLGAHSP